MISVIRVLYLDADDLSMAKDESYLDKLPASAIAAYKYAMLTLVDAGRGYCRYKAVLGDNRQSFTTENLKKYILLHCNYCD